MNPKIIITLLDKKYLVGQTVRDINSLFFQLSPNSEMITLDSLHKSMCEELKIYIAIDKSRIIGMGSICKIVRLGKVTSEIHDIVVDQEYRGQGIADSILQTLIKTAHKFGAPYIDLTSNPTRLEANQFYASRGFKRRDTNCYRMEL